MERARRRAPGNVTFVRGDVGRLPFADESFDIVLSLNGFHAFPNKKAAYAETFRVPKWGGVFCGRFYIRGENGLVCQQAVYPQWLFTPPYETLACSLVLMAVLFLMIWAAVALAPMSIACQGFGKEKGIVILPGSSWAFHGEEIPFTPFGLKKTPYGRILLGSLRAREVTMLDLYMPMIQQPTPASVIRAENITGPVLLISSKMDTMWPSEASVLQIMTRLREQRFSYPYRHLSYHHGSHLFVPMELSAAKFFRGDRGKHKEPGRQARMDSLEKTLEFVSQW